MAIRNVRQDGDEILRKKSKYVKEITPRTDELIDDLIENVHENNGVGLAAVQVGVLKRICVVSVDAPAPIVDEEGNEIEINPLIHNNGEDLIIINPEVIPKEGDYETDYEGCLSLPGKYGKVTRPFHVTLKAFDRNLEPYEIEAEGLFARAICHECDHMEGILYKDLVEGEIYDIEELQAMEEAEDEESGEVEEPVEE